MVAEWHGTCHSNGWFLGVPPLETSILVYILYCLIYLLYISKWYLCGDQNHHVCAKVDDYRNVHIVSTAGLKHDHRSPNRVEAKHTSCDSGQGLRQSVLCTFENCIYDKPFELRGGKQDHSEKKVYQVCIDQQSTINNQHQQTIPPWNHWNHWGNQKLTRSNKSNKSKPPELFRGFPEMLGTTRLVEWWQYMVGNIMGKYEGIYFKILECWFKKIRTTWRKVRTYWSFKLKVMFFAIKMNEDEWRVSKIQHDMKDNLAISSPFKKVCDDSGKWGFNSDFKAMIWCLRINEDGAFENTRRLIRTCFIWWFITRHCNSNMIWPKNQGVFSMFV